MSLHRLVSHVKSSLWFVPVMCVIAGSLLSFLTLAVDRRADYELVPASLTGGPDAALAVLTTVAASMVTLTALVLTITMVVVQLAMGQFSPRIVQTFLQDKPSQFAIGLFVATFAHSMLAMREVRFEEDPGGEAVPGLAIVVAYGLIVISIVVLVLYVHHIGRSLRVSALIELVGTATRKVMDEQYPDHGAAAAADPCLVEADHSGVVNRLDHERIVELAVVEDLELDLLPTIGAYVPAGAPLFRASAPITPSSAAALRATVLLGLERTLDQDMAYGFRMLVDVAERSIAESPFLDPTTAMQAIDRLHDCLRQLARRPTQSGEYSDAEGRTRLRMPVLGWDDFVHLAFDELILAGRISPGVRRNLLAALVDLRSVAPEDRRAVLDEAIGELLDDEDRAWEQVLDRATSNVVTSAAPTSPLPARG
jgi:uncharacterized membrane protein